MKEHFILQFKMLNRQLTEWGIEPIIGYFVASSAFLGVSIKLFTQYAEYIYIATVLSIVLKFSEVNRNEFLQLCYQNLNTLKFD
jgi:hypothetical protein